MRKFWNKAEPNEIFIFGEITGEKWSDTDITAKSFADDLKTFNGEDVTIHINSVGGDVFAATAISNVIKNYSGNVTILIDGLCASAASLITCAGNTVKMAKNALMMIHNPTVGLFSYFDENELSKVTNALQAIKESIITTYEMRTKKTREEIETMLKAETWLSADEALGINLIDEITGEVEAQFDNSQKIIFMNHVKLDCGRYDLNRIVSATHAVEMETEMNQTETDKTVAAAVTAERKRITDLNALKCENAAVNKIIDLAVADGKDVAEIQKYLDAVKSVEIKTETAPPSEKTIADKITAIIRDNMTSGAEGVEGSTPEDHAAKQKSQAAMLARFANEKLGAVKNGER